LISLESREFPDSGRGDFRLPAIHLRNTDGCTVSEFTYSHHEISEGKERSKDLPVTHGKEGEVSTLKVHLEDKVNQIEVVLNYSVFHKLDAITRSFELVNKGDGEVVIERAESFSVDMPVMDNDWEFVGLHGDWAREGRKFRRKVEWGTQGYVKSSFLLAEEALLMLPRFQSSLGYSSHSHNPFVALLTPETDEHVGPAYGFNLIYTGSHATTIEKAVHGPIRLLMGLNPLHLSYPLASGESFRSPECVAVFSNAGLGGMSRIYHRLYRDNLIASPWVYKDRPCLINNWEATYFDFTTEKLYEIASTASDLGVKMFVMDDGWFGSKHPRVNDDAGLGDWVVNPDRFPDGLEPFVEKVNKLGKGMKFGIWVGHPSTGKESQVADQLRSSRKWSTPSLRYTRLTPTGYSTLPTGREPNRDTNSFSISHSPKSKTT
jgi:alpha-galactosidase